MVRAGSASEGVSLVCVSMASADATLGAFRSTGPGAHQLRYPKHDGKQADHAKCDEAPDEQQRIAVLIQVRGQVEMEHWHTDRGKRGEQSQELADATLWGQHDAQEQDEDDQYPHHVARTCFSRTWSRTKGIVREMNRKKHDREQCGAEEQAFVCHGRRR